MLSSSLQRCGQDRETGAVQGEGTRGAWQGQRDAGMDPGRAGGMHEWIRHHLVLQCSWGQSQDVLGEQGNK